MISIIVAKDKNGCIGKNNTLPFSIREDLKRFKRLTTGHDIIMGSKTWDSLPKKPLPNRKNIIITRNNLNFYDNTNENIKYVNSLEEAFDISSNPFVIGGGQIYKQALKYTDYIYETILDIEVENGDTFFNYDTTQWIVEKSETSYEDGITITYNNLIKKGC